VDTKRLAVIAVAGVLSGLVLYGGTQPVALAGAGSSGAAQPARQKIHGQLIATDGAASNDVWAVGCCHYPISPFSHWDGTQWTTVDAHFALAVLDVDALSRRNVWAAGWEGIGHFDGSEWTEVLHNQDLFLEAVSATSRRDVWIAGKWLTAPESATVLHWDGTTWSEHDFPFAGPEFFSQDISASAANDVWMVLQSEDGGVVHIEHWDGTAWSEVSSPHPEFVPQGVVDLSPTDAWIVGYRFGSAEAVHWDGAQLSVARFKPPPGISELQDVSAASPTDIWAVGYQQDGPAEQALIVHWDGKSWSIVQSPFTSPHRTWLKGVTAISPDDAWAVGYREIGSGPQFQIAAHWDGTTWTRNM
jgi:hypothetical protein